MEEGLFKKYIEDIIGNRNDLSLKYREDKGYGFAEGYYVTKINKDTTYTMYGISKSDFGSEQIRESFLNSIKSL